MMTNNNCDIACKSGKFKRLRPFHGMLLTEDDFLQEQTYLREKIKLHNRLHGYGVVCGLELKTVDNLGYEIEIDDSIKYPIVVTSGMAIDRNGNEIIVCKAHVVSLDDKIQELFHVSSVDCPAYSSISGESNTKTVYIGIKYHEIKSEPQAVYAADCGCEEKRCDYSRIKEGYCVEVFTEQKLPWKPDDAFYNFENPYKWDPPCPLYEEKEHYVFLGIVIITKTNDTFEIEVKTYRRYIPMFPPSMYWNILENQLISQDYIKDIYENADWVNIAFVIGMNKDDAIPALQEEGFTSISSGPLDNPEILRVILMREAAYLPFAKKNGGNTPDHIALVHDENNIILFPIIIPFHNIGLIELLKLTTIKNLLKASSAIKKAPKSKKHTGKGKGGIISWKK